MRLYSKKAPDDDKSADPLKAIHAVSGVTAHELCRHYWEPEVRLDWETTVDRLTILARLDPSTYLIHQVHKRIWPAQQRDTVFWSHLCRRRADDGREWCVAVNHSVVDHPLEPKAVPGCVRATMTSCLAARTEGEVGLGQVNEPAALQGNGQRIGPAGEEMSEASSPHANGHASGQTNGKLDTQTRKKLEENPELPTSSSLRGQLRSHVSYSSLVDPGGWAPSAGLRLVCRREYPRFLERFTKDVVAKRLEESIQW